MPSEETAMVKAVTDAILNTDDYDYSATGMKEIKRSRARRKAEAAISVIDKRLSSGAGFDAAFTRAEEAGFFGDHEDIDGNEALLKSVLDAALGAADAR